MTMKAMLFQVVTISVSPLVLNVPIVDAKWFGNGDDDQAVSLKEFQSFWVDTIDVATSLDTYDKIWIKPHSCVWSECAVDDTDDYYMGDNRDGDGQWYQYRTQGFCANSAFSLYGRKKDEKLSFRGCSRRHFINSFFTYGGADTLLKSINKTPITYYNNEDGYANDGADDDANDDGSTNAACVEIEYDEGGDDDNYDSNSNSGSNDNAEYSASLGCSTDGNYVIAAFQSSSCDGNYFTDILDNFTDYNDQHSEIGCHKIYDSNGEVSVENIYTLLNNSWDCDLRLYPNGCPDPHGFKKQFEFAIRTADHGGNPYLAYKNMVWKQPLRIISSILLAMTIVSFVIAYVIKNESRAIQSKGGKNLRGYLQCVAEDIVITCCEFGTLIGIKCREFGTLIEIKCREFGTLIGIKCREFGTLIGVTWAVFMDSLTKSLTKGQEQPSVKKDSLEQNKSGSDTSDESVHIDETVENTNGNKSSDDVEQSFSYGALRSDSGLPL